MALTMPVREDECDAEITGVSDTDARYVDLAIALKTAGRNEEAVELLQLARRFGSRYELVYVTLAMAFQQQGKYQEAIDVLRELLKKTPQSQEGLRLLATIYFAMRNWSESVRWFEKAVDLANGGNPETCLSFGISLSKCGRHADAEWWLRHTVNLAPTYAEAYTQLADCLREQGKHGELERIVEEAVSANADNSGLYLSLGRSYARQHFCAQAKRAYTKSLERGHESYEAYDALGDLYHNDVKNFGKAIDCYSSALRFATAPASIYCDRANSYRALGRYVDAQKDIDRALAADPSTARPHFVLGLVYEDQFAYQESLAHFERASALAPKFTLAHVRVARSLLKLREYDAAEEACQRGLELCANHPDLHIQLGAIAEARGLYDEALTNYQRAIEASPSAVQAYAERCKIFQRRIDYGKALEESERAIVASPTSAEAHRLRALVHETLGQVDEARPFWEKAILLAPGLNRTYILYIGVLVARGDKERAAGVSAQLVSEMPESPLAHCLRGIVFQLTGNYTEAERSYIEATKVAPEDVGAYVALVHSLRDRREYSQAQAQARNGLRFVSPEAAGQLHMELGQLHQERGRDSLALREYGRAVGIASSAVSGYLARIGLFVERGRWSEAISECAAAVGARPENASLFDEYGQIYKQRGEFGNALPYYQRAIQLDPTFLPAYLDSVDALIALREYRKAEETCRQALLLGSNNRSVLERWVTISVEQHNLERALSQCEEILRENAATVWAHLLKARVLSSCGRYQDALTECQQAISVDPSSIAPLATAGSIYADQGDYAQSALQYCEAVSRDPSNASNQYLLVDALRNQGMHRIALRVCRRALKACPKEAVIWHSFGLVHLDNRHYQQAAAAFRRATGLNPTYAWSHARLAEALCLAGRFEEAQEACEAALEVSSDLSLIRIVKGEVLLQSRDAAGALTILRSAIQTDDDDWVYYLEALGNQLIGESEAFGACLAKAQEAVGKRLAVVRTRETRLRYNRALYTLVGEGHAEALDQYKYANSHCRAWTSANDALRDLEILAGLNPEISGLVEAKTLTKSRLRELTARTSTLRWDFEAKST